MAVRAATLHRNKIAKSRISKKNTVHTVFLVEISGIEPLTS